MPTVHDYFAPCPRGLETPLGEELQSLGAKGVRATPGGVAFRGPMEACWRANLGSRLASRVLLSLAHFPYKTEQDIYNAAHAIDWPALFELARTIRVETNAVRSPVKSLDS